MSKWIQDELTKLHNRLGVFFAFGEKQFNEQRVEGVEYVTVMQIGDCVPKQHVKEFVSEMLRLQKEDRERRLAEEGLDAIIESELCNHEAFYTGEIEDTLEALAGYNVTAEQVWAVYRAVEHKYEG